MMPLVLSQLVNEFAKPLTRPKWRQGGSFPSRLFLEGLYIEFDDVFNHMTLNVINYLNIYERALYLRD
jgi:hypothetical protein